MAYLVVNQLPCIAETIADMNQIVVDKPNLEPMTQCTVFNLDQPLPRTVEIYRWWGGMWSRTYPDQATIDRLNAIATIEGDLQTWATSVNTILAGKFDAPTGTTGQYVRGNGTLATFPTIPAAQVNADWNSSSGLSQILNKPSIPSGQVQTDWNATSGLASILNKPAQAAKVDAVTGSTTTGVVDILGIQVATGAAITTLGSTVAEIKTKLNAVISGAKTNGWMATV